MGAGGTGFFPIPTIGRMTYCEVAMNVQLPVHMDKSAFLAWVQGREGRYELSKGRVMMMTGGSRGHGIIMRRLANALEKRLDPNRWAVLTSDFGVDLGPETVRYPDVVVDVAGGLFKDLTATAPVLVAEVISPSSATYDLGDKAAEYLRSTSLSAYLVLAQDEAKVWLWIRGASGFSPGAEVIKGQDAVVRIASLGIDLPLSEIYAGIESP
jgi:Uma2 family endonuclease